MHHLKNIFDAIFGFITFAALANILPTVAAALAILWYIVRAADWAYTSARKWNGQDRRQSRCPTCNTNIDRNNSV